jgi:ribonuclease P protein component
MGLPADNRIRRSAEFRHVLSSGQGRGGRAGDRLLLLSAIPNDRSGHRVGLSVSKRVGGAVVRNRVKRRLREIFGEIAVAETGEGDQGWDIVATARPPAAEATYEELRTSAARLVSKVKSRR